MQEADTHTPSGLPRTRIVVLGSGWGAISFLRSLDPKLTSGMPPISVNLPKGGMLVTEIAPHTTARLLLVFVNKKTSAAAAAAAAAVTPHIMFCIT